MTDSNLVNQLFSQINHMIDYKLNTSTQIKSAVVHSINSDNTVNIYIPPSTTIYHYIQNQSIYQNLKSGDNVKVIVENGSLSNMWIIGGFGLNNANDNVINTVDNKNADVPELLERKINNGWIYERWSDGIAKCWYVTNYSNIEVYTDGQIFWSAKTIQFPIEFVELPIVHISSSDTSNVVHNSYDEKNLQIKGLTLNQCQLCSSVYWFDAGLFINISIVGKWK